MVAAELRISQRRKAAFTKPKLLAGFSPRRDLELSFAFDRWDIDLGAEGSLRDGDRYRDVNVVALALEEFVFAYVRQDEKVSGLGTEAAAVAFFRDSHTRTGIDARRDLDLYLLGFRRYAFAAAKRTRLAPSARTVAIRTFLRKLQTASRTHYLARAFTSWTSYHRSTGVAGTVTAGTLLAAIDGDIGCQAGK